MTIKAIKEAYKNYMLTPGSRNSFVTYDYNDGNGKHPCDKGVLCDACEDDTMVDLLWEGIKKMNDRKERKHDY